MPNNNTLILEKIDLPKTQLFSTQLGCKSYYFKGEEFTIGATISLEGLREKYSMIKKP